MIEYPRTALTRTLVAGLQTILIDGGSRTNIGASVFIGTIQPAEADAPCCVLIPGEETRSPTPPDTAPKGAPQILYTISAFDLPDGEHQPYEQIDAMLADIRDVVEGAGRPMATAARTIFYESAQPIYPEAGGRLCGVEVRYRITLPAANARLR